MKRIIFVLAMMLSVSLLYSQQKIKIHGLVETIIRGDGYVYNKDVAGEDVQLYNRENKWVNVHQEYKNGEMIDLDIIDAPRTAIVENDQWTKLKAFGIVHDAFTAEQLKQVAGKKLGIILYVNSETGKVDEVEFNFMSNGPYMSIPIPVFRQIETELKKNIWFKPTAKGKTLNYIFHGWRQDPNVTGR